MQLKVNLVYDDEFRGYLAEVPSLPGCMSHGKSIEEVLKNVRNAVVLYLDSVPRTHIPSMSAKPTLVTVVEV